MRPKDRKIVGLANAGLTNKQIAEAMKLPPRTVSNCLTRVYKELGIGGGTRGISRGQLRRVLGPPRTRYPLRMKGTGTC